MDRFFRKTIVVWAGALICCALWGSAFPGIKLGYVWMRIDAADTAGQILFAGIRFTMAGILAVCIGSLLQRRFLYPTRKSIPKVLILSLFQTVLQYLFFYMGLAHATGVNSSIIEGLNVFVAILIAAFLFHQEKVTLRKVAGCVIGFAGLIVVTLSGGSLGGFAWNGEGFIILSTIAYAFSSSALKEFGKTEDPVMLSGWQFIVGGLFMAIVGAAMGGRFVYFTGRVAGILLWLAFVSAAAYSLWGILLKYNPVSRVAVFGFMTPVFGVLLSAWLLREGGSISVSVVLALVLVCAGILICSTNGNRPADGE